MKLLGIREFVRRAEPEVLRIIGEESMRNGTHTMTSRQISQIIKSTRMKRKAAKPQPRPKPLPR